ncbi:uncharacterized protein PITG_18090 [Phytophthora infestans T30-4]|uniref:Uncharacterized protein n=1 Tax=Phytophthora infestans (strain T30-4) TaxID=403677 RepID=D0NY61_PHYIT|nr:uncharacterized protein PITG_18090 [Phytophthora infestans T30-4]EEY68019.1 conserved hypothetical protein [Phytophthora infestans T30-4]|eukprot:XP_002997718.1 conserved hypothetical protein [Phytophthora infestans T30-4]
MSAEYAARMEILQRKREELYAILVVLTAQRQAIEKRLALREATAAEFSAVALQSCKQKWKAQRNAAIAARKRNDEFVRSLHEAQKQVHDTWSRLHSDQSSRSALLAQEKARYNRRVEQIYPAWQEQLQRQRVQRLRELEDKKRAVERRRYLAKKSFEKEQTLDDLIRKTRHEVEMAESLEQNELYERDLLRTQSTNQAKEVDQSIRDVALEARSVLQQQAAKHFEARPELDEELAAFAEDQLYAEEKPVRQIRVEIPTRMDTPTRGYYAEVSQQGQNEEYSGDEYFEDAFVDETRRERLAPFSSTTTGKYDPNSYAGNDDASFQQSSYRNQPAAGVHNAPSWAAAGHTFSLTTSYPEISRKSQQSPAPPSTLDRSTNHEQVSVQSVEDLSSMITGKLYPIPEVNEPIFSSRAISMAPDRIAIRDYEVRDILGRYGSGVATMPVTTAADEPPVHSLPIKSEESRGTSSPATPVTNVHLVDDTWSARADTNRPIGRQDHVRAPKVLIPEAKSQRPPAISIPLPTDSHLTNSFTTARATMDPVEVALHGSSDQLRNKTENEAALSEVKPPVDDLSLSVDTVSTPSLPDNTSTPAIAASGEWLETTEISAEDSDTNQLQKTDSFDDQEAEQALNQDSASKSDSFHDAAPLGHTTIKATLPVTETSAVDAAEVAVEKIEKPSVKAVAGVSGGLPPPISYRLDLLESFSAASTPRNAQHSEDDMVLTSMQSDDFDMSANSTKSTTADTKPIAPSNDESVAPNVNTGTDVASVEDLVSPPEPSTPALEEVKPASLTEKLAPVDRVKALGALICRVEEVLFPPKAFEGIMNDQKIRKLHQSNKEKQLDSWKALSGHLKQLAQLSAVPTGTLVELFVAAFLAHDPDNQRSQRKLREFIVTVCGGGDSKTSIPRKETFGSSKPSSSHWQEQHTSSPETAKLAEPAEPEGRIGTPQLLQTAFLQRQSPPKPKVFGIASSSFKDRSSGSSDVLMSMSSRPMKLSQKLMRGGKMNDYSEFEEEEEVDLQNLIGTKPTFASGSSALSRSHQASKTSPTARTTGRSTAVEEESDEFNADF